MPPLPQPPARSSPGPLPRLHLQAEGLACLRGGRLVFEHVSFEVRTGQLLALTGPNGAGKSTLLRLLAGLLTAAAGRMHWVGAQELPRGAFHYLGHSDGLKPALTLRETLAYWALLFQATPDRREEDRQHLAAECAGAVGLAHALDLPVAVLSAGQRKRAGLARLLLGERPLWLLDEPTSALDRDGIAVLGSMMAAHLGRGGVIVAASHEPLPVAPAATLALGGYA